MNFLVTINISTLKKNDKPNIYIFKKTVDCILMYVSIKKNKITRVKKNIPLKK